jgi:hypothetical protein
MEFSILSAAVLFLSFFPNSSHASCAGAKSCNPCYDSLLGTEKQDVICNSENDCVAIPHRCDGFYFLNKTHSKKFIDPTLKTNPAKKAPTLECSFNEGWQTKICQAQK